MPPRTTTGIQATFGIDFAPAQMVDRGLAEAHNFPLVSYGKLRSEYTSWRVPAAEAWRFPEVEQRTPNSYPVMVVDVDGRNASARIHEALFGGMPVPNWIVQRKSTGGCHAFWVLKRPPLYGVDARPKPAAMFTRITEWYVSELEADPNFIGVLSHNAVYEGGEFATDWLAPSAYSLSALAKPIPRGWQRPARPALRSAVGRNRALFDAGMQWAGSIHRLGMPVLPIIEALNREFEHPLPPSEAAGIARSIERYREKWKRTGAFWGPGNHTYGDAEDQRQRGRRSGMIRRRRTADRDGRVNEMRAEGASYRAIAEAEGISVGMAHHIVNRVFNEPTQLMPPGGSEDRKRGDESTGGGDSPKIAHQSEPIVDKLWTVGNDAPTSALSADIAVDFDATDGDRLVALATAEAWDDAEMVLLHQRARTDAATGNRDALVALERVRKAHRQTRLAL